MTTKMPAVTLATPVNYAKGVGEIRAAQLAVLGIKTCEDLLEHLPRDYLHYSPEGAMAEMAVGDVATVRGTVLQTRLIRQKPRRFEALLQDASPGRSAAETPRRCVLTWFNPYGMPEKVQPGMMLRVTGKVTMFRDRFQMVQPQFEELKAGEGEEAGEEAERAGERIEAVYPGTMELPSPRIGRIIGQNLEALLPQVGEWFEEGHLRERNFFTRREAFEKIHRPGSLPEAIKAKRTLAYHEFFLHQAAMAIKRYHQRTAAPAVPLRVDDAVDARIRALLPFELTEAQNAVIGTLRKDLEGTRPMNRLLQGDVGSGKTVVALYAMLAAVATGRGGKEEVGSKKLEGGGGHQAALMAPTELLAEQHFVTLSKFLEGKRVQPTLLTGSVKGAERARIVAGIADGSASLIVGTHALLSEAVQFRSLAMIVVDEQHKFGVEQRSQIRTKPAGSGGGALAPHTLVMTATPIPRTLAMTAFGDLDVSVIDALPPGRQPIHTRVESASNRGELYKWLAGKLEKGEQAYIVVPTIDEAPEEDAELPGQEPLRSAMAVHRELQNGALEKYRVGVVHGRMAAEVRQHVMERFRQHLIDALVATTVIEVGVDVPNASIMVVEHAERFGLSQLHQLRGRVGRGSRASTCVLVTEQTTDEAVARTQAMVKHTSGFKIADADLKLRGMGQLIGTAQSGRSNIHFAELLFDPYLLPLSRRDAFQMVAGDPRLLDPGHAVLRGELLRKFATTISLADVG